MYGSVRTYSQPAPPATSRQRTSNAAALMAVGAVLMAAMLMLAVSKPWLDFVVEMENSPVATPLLVPDIPADYIAGIVWAIMLTGIVALWGTLVNFRAPLLIAWISKATLDLGPMLLYDFRYGVEPDGYFRVASFAEYAFDGFHFGSGTDNIRGLAWLHQQFLFNSFTAARLTFALVGLWAVYLMYRAVVVYLGHEDHRIFYAFAFLPSILFWSSILGKDPISLFGVTACTYGVTTWYMQGRLRGLVWIITGALIAAYIRIWLASFLLLPLVTFLCLGARTSVRRAGFGALVLIGTLLSPLIVQQMLDTQVVRVNDVLEKVDRDSRSFPDGGSTQAAPELQTVGQIARFAPLGAFTMLFRPLPGEVMNPWGFLTGIENLFLLLLAFRAVARTRFRDLRQPMVLWALGTLLIWSATYSVTAYQNLGTAARHRLEVTPLMFALLLYLGRARTALAPRPALRFAVDQTHCAKEF